MRTKKSVFIYLQVILIWAITISACTSDMANEGSFPTITPILPTFTSLSPSQTPLPSPTLVPSTSKYSFENEFNGWINQIYPNAMACFQVSQSDELSKDGHFSLKLDIKLIGNDEHNSQGEAWVDMKNFPPNDGAHLFEPINLTNQTIYMWVFAPSGAMGDNSKPNGFQIFVKDINWKSSYSAWTNVVENQWVELSFTVTTIAVENGDMSQGFDPSQIIAVGIKMGAGGESTAIYHGPIYIDAVDW